MVVRGDVGAAQESPRAVQVDFTVSEALSTPIARTAPTASPSTDRVSSSSPRTRACHHQGHPRTRGAQPKSHRPGHAHASTYRTPPFDNPNNATQPATVNPRTRCARDVHEMCMRVPWLPMGRTPELLTVGRSIITRPRDASHDGGPSPQLPLRTSPAHSPPTPTHPPTRPHDAYTDAR